MIEPIDDSLPPRVDVFSQDYSREALFVTISMWMTFHARAMELVVFQWSLEVQ